MSQSVKLPLKHLSLRVPWHDSGWTGTICSQPSTNASCLALSRTREGRNDELELSKKGLRILDLPQEEWPPCVAERATFMAPDPMTRMVEHPYARLGSDEFKHLLPTPLLLPPFSAGAVPFRWMTRRFAWELAEELKLNVSEEREPRKPDWIQSSAWVQDFDNQSTLLDAFFSAVVPDQSLCFFYAKQTPLSDDDGRRVLIGAARVRHVGHRVEQHREKPLRPTQFRSNVWERVIEHTLGPTKGNGFLLPYEQVLHRRAKEDPAAVQNCIAFAPVDHWVEFSYASEHVSHDGAIASLLECRRALAACRKLDIPVDDDSLTWIDARIADTWKRRGAFPGLASALSAFGFQHGALLAYEITGRLDPMDNPWPHVAAAIERPSSLSGDIASGITTVLRDKWKLLTTKKPWRLQLLQLLSRVEITREQAARIYQEEQRAVFAPGVADDEILRNPYRLFEIDRVNAGPLGLGAVDRALFPEPTLRIAHPLPDESKPEGPDDRRRIRALVTDVLEGAASQGSTIQPRADVVTAVRELAIEPPCPLDGEALEATAEFMTPEFTQLADTVPLTLQLRRLTEMGRIIRKCVLERLGSGAKRNVVSADWQALLEKRFGPIKKKDEDETRARVEKTRALQELAEARFSVLVGAAGTGKTEILSLLCSVLGSGGGVIKLLAPTGKARVRLEQGVRGGLRAETIAQFLLQYGRYEPLSGTYRLSKDRAPSMIKTLIIDEASMLTEEQLGAVLDAFTALERIILVGDPRQLPPIGAGRPFVDIIKHVEPSFLSNSFPRVGNGFAELTVGRRQTAGTRRTAGDDAALAQWFSGRSEAAVGDAIISHVSGKEELDGLRFVRWDSVEELESKLAETMREELELGDDDDANAFEVTYGARTPRGAEPESPEAWQVLTPYRNLPTGSSELNRFIQRSFRGAGVRHALQSWIKPAGIDGIIVRDKVINVRNTRELYVQPASRDVDGKKVVAAQYVANGEIGIVRDAFAKKKTLKVELAPTQPGFTYFYEPAHLGDEGDCLLELAYAITVHKSQGSEFGCTFVVVPSSVGFVSRELLYTACTRHRDRMVVLHQGNVSDLWKYASPYFSETARRLTNLFAVSKAITVTHKTSPKPRIIDGLLVHRTEGGQIVKSKNEYIIVEALERRGIAYEYEEPLVDGGGRCVHPDFTIRDANRGVTYYWEHLGMIDKTNYREQWKWKLGFYSKLGILPLEQGGGPNGTLITTNDADGFDGVTLREILDRVWPSSG